MKKIIFLMMTLIINSINIFSSPYYVNFGFGMYDDKNEDIPMYSTEDLYSVSNYTFFSSNDTLENHNIYTFTEKYKKKILNFYDKYKDDNKKLINENHNLNNYYEILDKKFDITNYSYKNFQFFWNLPINQVVYSLILYDLKNNKKLYNIIGKNNWNYVEISIEFKDKDSIILQESFNEYNEIEDRGNNRVIKKQLKAYGGINYNEDRYIFAPIVKYKFYKEEPNKEEGKFIFKLDVSDTRISIYDKSQKDVDKEIYDYIKKIFK